MRLTIECEDTDADMVLILVKTLEVIQQTQFFKMKRLRTFFK